jgi:hypothetical protein
MWHRSPQNNFAIRKRRLYQSNKHRMDKVRPSLLRSVNRLHSLAV